MSEFSGGWAEVSIVAGSSIPRREGGGSGMVGKIGFGLVGLTATCWIDKSDKL